MPTLTPEQQAAIQSYLARQAGQRVDLQGSVAGSVAAARNPQIRGGPELLKGLGAGFAGAPVDIASAVMRPFGLLGQTPQQNVVGSSDWFGRMMGADPSSAPFVAGSIGVPDPTDLAKVAAKFDPATISAIMAGIPVFHGSPHRFPPTPENPLGAFDLSKMGTGEGAQARGYGAYLAESPEVAGEYANRLGANAYFYGGNALEDGPKRTAAELLWSWNGDKAGALDDALNAGYDDAQAIATELKQLDFSKLQKGGSLYHVDIPDEHIGKMLDLDKTWQNQSREVKQILKDAGVIKEFKANLSDFSSPQGTRGQGKGDNIYAYLSHKLGGDKQASEYLRSIGIPGSKFLDEGSREAKRGTRNIVLFDDKLAKITKRE